MTEGGGDTVTDTRLIERWLPIAALGEESVRERRSIARALPPTYYLHVWWARRPLVAARAADAGVTAARGCRPGDQFLHVLGIHGDPVAAKKRRIAACEDRTREHGWVPGAYGYSRAFGYTPDSSGQGLASRELGER